MSVTRDLPRGTLIVDYRVEAVLGRGGMSVVYLAEDLRLKRQVALKLLAPALAEDERFRERFLSESELAASLDHANVIPVYEAGEAEGSLYIAMRYVEGSDLKARLGDGPLSDEETVALVVQVGGALDAAHERGLVHGDVKPSNVLIDGHGHAYLADFGLTKRLGDEPSPAGEAQLMGTIDYVAPEQIRGDQVDGRADIYSLGCLLYECLTGRQPFKRGNDAAVLYAHLEDEPPATGSAADPVIAKALAKDPDDRYQTCAELVEAARDALGVAGGARQHVAAGTRRRFAGHPRRGRRRRSSCCEAAAERSRARRARAHRSEEQQRRRQRRRRRGADRGRRRSQQRLGDLARRRQRLAGRPGVAAGIEHPYRRLADRRRHARRIGLRRRHGRRAVRGCCGRQSRR